MSVSTTDAISITRTFTAPRELVFRAWTEPEYLVRWWGPAGSDFSSATVDLQPGGAFHYCVKTPMGHEMWSKFVYHEIVAPERLVFVNSFSDADGGITRSPFAPSWPREILNVLTFTERGGVTSLHMQGGPYNASSDETASFEAGKEGVQYGIGLNLDQLDTLLVQIQQG